MKNYSVVQGRQADVYIGVDVFARGKVVGGMLETNKVETVTVCPVVSSQISVLVLHPVLAVDRLWKSSESTTSLQPSSLPDGCMSVKVIRANSAPIKTSEASSACAVLTW